MQQNLILSDDEKRNLKSLVIDSCLSIKRSQINELLEMLQSLKSSVESNEKSSAGDKHETGRENANQTLLIYSDQHRKSMEDLMVFMMLKPDKLVDTVQLGAIVVLNDFIVFIADNLNKVTVDKIPINILSPKGPFVQCMLGKPKGFEFHFNNKDFKIIEVF
jgi:hypothetical protein